MYLRVIFISVFILSFISTFFLHGCSSNQIVKMDTLIYNKDNVDFAQIKSEWASSAGVAESKGSRTLDTPGDINVILNKIENINVNKLSPREDVKFMIKDKHVYEEHLTVDLLREGEIMGKTGTIFKVWPDGSIYIIDIKSMASSERTISYLATEKHPDFYQWLTKTLRSSSNEFNLSVKEKEIYNNFQNNLDEKQLIELDPISIAKIYVQARLDNKNNVVYALYTDKKEYVQWTKEEDENIPDSDRGTKEQILKIFNNIESGKFIQTSDFEGYIEYQPSEDVESKSGFRMIKDDDGIWNVAFLPIQ